ncbi:MAG: lysophospholipid acyltransferase family protein [Chitinophagales bacterium]
MKKILSGIYSFYVGLLFFLCLVAMLLLYVPLLLIRNDRTRMRIIYILNDFFLLRIWSPLSGIWVKVEGREKISNDKVYAFVCNHSNMLDIPITASVIKHYYKPLVKKELLKMPVFGQLLSMTSLPVDRKDPESRKRSTEKMIEWMKGGLSLLIFPEGTRNRTPEPVKEFYDGAFKVAIEAQAYIAPFVLLNIRHLQPVDSNFVFPGTVTVRFLDPIDTKGMTADDTHALKERTRQLIGNVLAKEDVLFKSTP